MSAVLSKHLDFLVRPSSGVTITAAGSMSCLWVSLRCRCGMPVRMPTPWSQTHYCRDGAEALTAAAVTFVSTDAAGPEKFIGATPGPLGNG